MCTTQSSTGGTDPHVLDVVALGDSVITLIPPDAEVWTALTTTLNEDHRATCDDRLEELAAQSSTALADHDGQSDAFHPVDVGAEPGRRSGSTPRSADADGPTPVGCPTRHVVSAPA